MDKTTQFLVEHGAPIVFVAVFLEQMGLPLPVVPLLLAAGALSATGQFNLLFGLGIALLACLIADTIWFYLGRYRGIDAWRELNYPLEMASRPPKPLTPIHRGAAAQDKSSSGPNLRKAV